MEDQSTNQITVDCWENIKWYKRFFKSKDSQQLNLKRVEIGK